MEWYGTHNEKGEPMEITSRIEIEKLGEHNLRDTIEECIKRIEEKYPREKISKIKFEVILTDDKLIMKETDEVKT